MNASTTTAPTSNTIASGLRITRRGITHEASRWWAEWMLPETGRLVEIRSTPYPQEAECYDALSGARIGNCFLLAAGA